MAMFALVLMGEQIFASIGIPTPDFVKKMQESKWYLMKINFNYLQKINQSDFGVLGFWGIFHWQ